MTPIKIESPCGMRSPRMLNSPKSDSYYRLRSPSSHVSSGYTTVGSPCLGSPNTPNATPSPKPFPSPNYLGSPSQGRMPSPGQPILQLQDPPCRPKPMNHPTPPKVDSRQQSPKQQLSCHRQQMSPNNRQQSSPSYFQQMSPNGRHQMSPSYPLSPQKYDYQSNIYYRRESPRKSPSPSCKLKPSSQKGFYPYTLTPKMYPPFAVPFPPTMSPLNMMAGMPSMISSPAGSRSLSVSHASTVPRNGVSNSHQAFNVPSFDEDLLPVLSPTDEIPDFLSQTSSMLGYPPSSTSSAQHTFNLHGDLVSLD